MKSKIKIYSAITIFTLTSLAQAENHLLLFGGGGEPQSTSTVFDSGIANLGQNLKNSKWKYQASFNGGHSVTEGILNTNFSASSTPTTNFTAANYKKMIEDYKNKIISGQIKSGDQLLVFIYSHGAQPSPGQLTHKIAASGKPSTDLNKLTGANLVSLDSLQELVQLAEKKGVKLGIADLTCHSGATLALKKNAPNTCIISATSSEHYGYGGPNSFSSNFLKGLTPGKSLEEVFLNARLSSASPDYPMISTPANDKIVKAVYSNITPYLYYYSPNQGNKMTDYILNNSGSEQVCKREENFKDLISQIDYLESTLNLNSKVQTPPKILPTNLFNSNQPKRSIWNPFRMRNPFTNAEEINMNSPSAMKLKDLLIAYKESQDRILLSSQNKLEKLEKVENFPYPKSSGNLLAFKVNYTWREILELDVASSIQYYTDLKNKTSGKINKEAQDKINFFMLVNQKKLQIIRTEPQLKNYKVDIAILVRQMNNSLGIAQEISKHEKILYDEMYRKSSSVKKDDPCKQIIF